MHKSLITSCLIIFLLSLFSGKLSAQTDTEYKSMWNEIEKFEKDGLTKSALEVANKIYETASKEKSQAQKIKSLFYIGKYEQRVLEDSEWRFEQLVKKEIETTPEPYKSYLESILAENYLQYLQNNFWQISKRTEVVSTDLEDFRTWSIADLEAQIHEHYKASLEGYEKLNQEGIEELAILIARDEKRDSGLRPLHYDFLGNRVVSALQYYSSQGSTSRNSFQLREEEVFADSETFVNYDFKGDEQDLKLLVIETFQALEKHNRGNQEILVDNVLTRLNYASTASDLNEKSKLHINALQELLESLTKQSESVRVAADLAQKLMHSEELRAEDILNKAIAEYPNDKYAENSRQLLAQIKGAEVNLNLEPIVLPEKASLISVSYRNVNKVYIQILELDRLSYKWLTQSRGRRLDEVRNLLLNSKREIVEEWSEDLPFSEDRKRHQAVIDVPALGFGKYVVLISSDPDFSTKEVMQFAPFQVSEFMMLHRGKTNSDKTEVMVVNRIDGKAIEGVKLTALKQDYNRAKREPKLTKLGTFLTDKIGLAQMSFEQTDARYFELEKGEDHLFHQEYIGRNRTHTPNIKNQLRLFTDRSIYRPGQEVHFKGIFLKPMNKDFVLPEGTSVQVSLLDTNREEISQQEFTSNEFGSINGSFEIPIGRINGAYYLKSQYGEQSIQVEEYKRPKFEVSLEQPKDELKLNNNVAVSGRATSYVGLPIADAKVSYRVIREPYFSYWCWYTRFYGNTETVEIANGELLTGADGNFEVVFDALDNGNPNSNFTYKVVVSITDSNGETRGDELNVRIGNRSMFVRIDMPERIILDEDTPHKISAITLNEQNLSALLSYEIFKADLSKTAKREDSFISRFAPDSVLINKEKFYQDFPQFSFPGDEVKGPLHSSGTLSLDGEENAEIDVINDLEPGYYTLVVSGTDKDGLETKSEKSFSVIERKKGKAVPLSWFYWDMKNGRVLQSEDKELLIGSPYDITVRVTVQGEKGKLLDETIELANNQVSLDLGISKKYVGAVRVSILAIWEGELKREIINLEVIDREPVLEYKLSTFRNNLRPGEAEKWRISISGKDNEKASAELLSTMYDASLDSFLPHKWNVNLSYPRGVYVNPLWNVTSRNFSGSRELVRVDRRSYKTWYEAYPTLNWFQFRPGNQYAFYSLEEVVVTGYGGGKRLRKAAKAEMDMESADGDGMPGFMDNMAVSPNALTMSTAEGVPIQSKPPKVKLRKNLQETAFFFPDLRTNEKGEIVLEFEAPEALTKWKWMNFAHSKDLDSVFWEEEVVTKKELMVTPNAPRFLRQGDDLVYSAKVSNTSDKALSGKIYLELIDPLTEKSVNHLFNHEQLSQDFNLDPDESSSCDWYLEIPEGISAITCTVIADSGEFSDGEATTVPVLTDRVLVTETLPMPQRKAGKKTFALDKLLESNSSSTIKHHRVTLEYSSNPSWYAVQALPSLMEYPYKCSEQIFNRMYANALAAHITEEYPAIEKVFREWEASAEQGGEDLLSNLEKNEELKSAILEETPWLRDAKSESEQKRMIAQLFDKKRVKESTERAVSELQQRQLPDGGWPWFGGLTANLFVTQYIVTGFGHLDHLNVKSVKGTDEMLDGALGYMDQEMYERYSNLKRHGDLKKYVPGRFVYQYLYARSFYHGKVISKRNRVAYDYFYAKAQEHWIKQNYFLQGMIALASNRSGDSAFAYKVLESLKENTVESEELGRYFKNISQGYYWAEAPIERHALLIEAFEEINDDQETVDGLKTWLLKQKQVQDWRTTKATADACYALILTGGDDLGRREQVDISVGQEAISFDGASAGTGYIKQNWSAEEVVPEMGTVNVEKKTDGVSWGALYWQYFEKMEKVEQAETPLSIKKDLFKEINTDQGPQLIPLTPEAKLVRGDLVKVRIEIRVDRDMEFVHLKDQRSSGFEPVDVISQYKYQDGLGYYQMVRDANTNFFFDYLPKGVYVFEYPLRVFHNGDFSNGISTIQCMYAPEFSSHSKGVRVKVAKE